MISLGIHAYTHDSAAALVRDGIVIAAAEEERFNGIKHTDAFPRGAIEYCLAEAGVSLAEVDTVAVSWKPWFKVGKRAAAFIRFLPDSLANLRPSPDRRIRSSHEIWNGIRRLPAKIQTEFGKAPNTRFLHLRHHDCHAASAFLVSPFRRAAVLSCDACGEWDTTALYTGSESGLDLVSCVGMPNSIGLAYGALTQFLGYKIKSDEGRVMALAALGEPSFMQEMSRILYLSNGCGPRVDIDFFRFHLDTKGKFFSDRLIDLFGPPRKPGSKLSLRDQNLAASLQLTTEEMLIGIASNLLEKSGHNALCVAGGVGLNSKANGRLIEQGIVSDLFVQPAANDAGTALGAALLADGTHQGQRQEKVAFSPYLGPEPLIQSVAGLARAEGFFCRTVSTAAQVAAQLLVRGKIIGWHQGRMEFGPRALGNRSILADPRYARMKDHINARVKYRESFRPFAPAILREAQADFFESDHPVPHMTTVLTVRPQARELIPATVHSDGSARLQTCCREENPLFHDLISSFGRITGVPVVLNTSLNVNGKPIAATPRESLDCLRESGLDCLFIGNIIIWKDESFGETIDAVLDGMS